jgi:hypothetical protein
MKVYVHSTTETNSGATFRKSAYNKTNFLQCFYTYLTQNLQLHTNPPEADRHSINDSSVYFTPTRQSDTSGYERWPSVLREIWSPPFIFYSPCTCGNYSNRTVPRGRIAVRRESLSIRNTCFFTRRTTECWEQSHGLTDHSKLWYNTSENY